jgi:putative tricarboxylic transport membrane protein
MGKKSNFPGELVFNLLLMALGIYVVVTSLRIGFGTLREPDAGFFPFVGGLIILISNFSVLAREARENQPFFPNRAGIPIFFMFTAIAACWILFMPYLGYVIMSFLAVLGLSKVMKLEGWGKPILLSSVVAFFIYLLFDYWLYLDLPRGILG